MIVAPVSTIETPMKMTLLKLFLVIVFFSLILSGCATKSTTSSPGYDSTLQIKSLSPRNNKDLYQVTCDNGKQHTIIANDAEQDYQYYYPDKGYYIKYYDTDFKDLISFARWVCLNK